MSGRFQYLFLSLWAEFTLAMLVRGIQPRQVCQRLNAFRLRVWFVLERFGFKPIWMTISNNIVDYILFHKIIRRNSVTSHLSLSWLIMSKSCIPCNSLSKFNRFRLQAILWCHNKIGTQAGVASGPKCSLWSFCLVRKLPNHRCDPGSILASTPHDG